MLSDKMQEKLNDQLNFEAFSAYIYMAMSAYFESMDLPGFSNWMRIQTQEELFHSSKFFDYINDRDGRVVLKQIDGPPTEWESPLAAFEDALKHEKIVTSRIHALAKMAMEEGDQATYTFLQWFVNEQIEEEANVRTIVQHLKMVGKEGYGLFMLDRELGQRVFTMPTTTA